MSDTIKSYEDDRRHAEDLLKNLDGSKGGIPATAEVKNKDVLMVLDPAIEWTKEFVDDVLFNLAALKLGYIRTLTVVRGMKGEVR